MAMGLQEVDGLKPSPHLCEVASEHVRGVRGLDERDRIIRACYARQEESRCDTPAAQREVDLVSQRIIELLTSGAFTLVSEMLTVIHGTLFQDFDVATCRPGE